MAEYAIQPPSLRCSQTGRDLKPGEVYYSALSETPNGFVRTDYSPEAWSGPPDGALAFWRSVVAPAKERRTVIDASVLIEFFHRLADSDDPYKHNVRFILALLLVRRKALKMVGSAREGDTDLLVLQATGGEQYQVVNPDLTEEQLVALEAEVEKMLQSSVE